MTYSVYVTPKAAKQLDKIPSKQQIRQKIFALSRNPFPQGYKKLKGVKDAFRIRVGSYRVLYRLSEEKLIVFSVSHRKNAYH